jgi:hypothetical protein
MLSQTTISKIAGLLKVKPEDLTAAITDAAEKDVTIPDTLASFTELELTTLNKNKYEEGKKAGVEMGVDELKKELSLDFQGKTIKGLVEAASKKAVADAKIEPNEKVTQLTKELETVRATAKDFETKYQTKEQEVESIKTIGDIHKALPVVEGYTPEEVLALAKVNGYEFKKENGEVVPYLNGQPVKDKLAQNRKADEVAKEFLLAKKLPVAGEIGTPPAHGRGGGNDKPPAAYSKLSDVKAKFTAEGKSLNGEEFMNAVEQAQAANKDFDMKS